MNILFDVSFEKLKEASDENIAKAIILNREEKVKVKPGYDGVYGEPSFGEEIKITKRKQSNLTEF
jgi:PHP family Zn ribbon phosphoesterase